MNEFFKHGLLIDQFTGLLAAKQHTGAAALHVIAQYAAMWELDEVEAAAELQRLAQDVLNGRTADWHVAAEGRAA
jgi:hypothetical protein